MPPHFATKDDVESVRQDFRIHMKDDRDFQDRMFAYLKGEFDVINSKIDTLWDEKNKREGYQIGKTSTEQSVGKKAEKITGFFGYSLNLILASVTAYCAWKTIWH